MKKNFITILLLIFAQVAWDTLLQVLRYQKRGQKGWSWSYVFDKNVSKSSIAGLSYLEEDEGAPQCQNKIMKADEIMEDGTKGSETIYYYSKIP